MQQIYFILFMFENTLFKGIDCCDGLRSSQQAVLGWDILECEEYHYKPFNRSAFISSIFSKPTETLTRLSFIPASALSSSDNRPCVVVEG